MASWYFFEWRCVMWEMKTLKDLVIIKAFVPENIPNFVGTESVFDFVRRNLYDRIANDEAVYGYIWSVANNLCKNYWRRREKESYAEIQMQDLQI